MDIRALDYRLPYVVTYIFNTLVAPASRGFIWLVVSVANYLQNYAPWWLRWDKTLPTLSLVAGSTSAALEQTSPHKLKAAEYGMILAIVSLILLLADLIYKHQHRKKANKDNPRLHQSSDDGWDFADTFGPGASVLVLISASLHYHYLSSSKQQPIRFSMLPLAISICVFGSRIFRQPAINRKPVSFMVCRYLGRMRLEADSGGARSDTDGHTEFSCAICNSGRMHPPYAHS